MLSVTTLMTAPSSLTNSLDSDLKSMSDLLMLFSWDWKVPQDSDLDTLVVALISAAFYHVAHWLRLTGKNYLPRASMATCLCCQADICKKRTLHIFINRQQFRNLCLYR